jgi:hypothetical protein
MPLGDQRWYLAVAILCLGAIGFTGILSLSPSSVFQPYFLSSPPLLVVAVVIILIDLGVGLPYRHVPPPRSFLFYPTMAVVAEIVFHVLPLSLLLVTLGPLAKRWDPTRLV